MNRKALFPLSFLLFAFLFSGVASTSAEEGIVGVQVGESYEYVAGMRQVAYSTSNGSILLSTPYAVSSKLTANIKEISGTNVTLETEAIYFSSGGSETKSVEWIDVTSGNSTMSSTSGFLLFLLISADCNAGDFIYPEILTTAESSYPEGIPENMTELVHAIYSIDSTLMKRYGDQTIEVNYQEITGSDYFTLIDPSLQNQSYIKNYWDRATGMLLECEQCYIYNNPYQTDVTVAMYMYVVRTDLPQTFWPLTETDDHPIVVDSNSTIMGFDFNKTEKQLSLNVTGTAGTNGYCDITVPDDLIWGTFSLYMDGSPLVMNVDYTQTHNGTHYTFHITYTHSTHTIVIAASQAIPEFPSLTILPVLLIITLLAITVNNKRFRLKTKGEFV